ncbi:DUF4350 domain-containing protein [Amphritea balenae]|uniref:DUF4350 domain-containing protein n=1 Tax=Amphritea balenae TaxID=452629 RepID=A0A3P1STK7_9GAMM|nr:DUF4350 domain-containing protein [Amphritea balenae]RRD00544.1 DUF4350 domain-containing protein [Amphritea balenae]GGK69863.1 hypothetical protein GCM10007941_20110 [Amphritea balenae]
MSLANKILLWTLAALLLLGVSWYTVWFFTNYERQTKQELVDISPEARRNPWLAAERYLQQLGYSTETYSGRDQTANLPPVTDTLLLRRLQTEMTDTQLYRLNDWVEAGGTLIISPQVFTDTENIKESFIQDLGVRLRESLSIENDDTDETVAVETGVAESASESSVADKNEAKADPEKRYHQVSFTLFGEPESISAGFRRDRFLEDSDSWAVERGGNGAEYHYLRFEIGQGAVAVLSDLDLFSNERIGQLDHAFILGHMVADSPRVWLQYSPDMPGLPELLWQKMPFVVISLLLLLILMGWRLFLYTGPTLSLQDRQRRNLLEHIEATASYAWRIDRGRGMFESNRQALEQAWRRRHPVLNPMTQAQRGEWIGEKTGMTASAVERSLYHSIDKDQDFIKATLVLQQLASGLKQRELG